MNVGGHMSKVADSRKAVAEGVRMGRDGSARFGREDEAIGFKADRAGRCQGTLFASQFVQLGERPAVDRQSPNTGACLGLLHHCASGGSHDAFVDLQRQAFEVEVRPPKGTSLSSAHPGGRDHPQENRQAEVLALRGSEEGMDLGGSGRPNRRQVFGRPGRQFGVGDAVGKGVATPAPRKPTRPVQHGASLAHRCLGEPRGFQAPEELLDVKGAERPNPATAYAVTDVDLPDVLVAPGRGTREVVPSVALPRFTGRH